MSDNLNPIYDKSARRYGHGYIYYCAPWCGANCTHKEFLKATEEAEALAKRLGDGWEAVVWENMGWHYEVVNGVMTCHPAVRRTGGGRHHWTVVGYTVYVNAANQFVERGDTPEDAIRAALTAARRHVNQLIIELAPFNEAQPILQLGLSKP